MNLERLQRTLLDTARQTTPSDRVPYAFEQRVMARIRAAKNDPLAIWGSWLWRSAVSACALAVVTGVISLNLAEPPLDGTEPAVELASVHLEDALFASADGAPEIW